MAVHTILLRPPTKKRRSKFGLQSTKSKSKSGFQLLRNKAGELYFRWPHDDGASSRLVTYHVYLKGEAYLRERGIGEDDYLPVRLAREIKNLGYLYTGKASSRGGRYNRDVTRLDLTAGKRQPEQQVKRLAEQGKSQTKSAQPSNSSKPSEIIRQIHLFGHKGGTAVFRLPAALGEPLVESRPFPKSDLRQKPHTRLVDQIFNDFLLNLKKQGWTERGKGQQWYELKMTRKV